LQGRITNIEGSYVTEDAVITTVSSRITASFESNGIGSSSLAAGVNQEAIARATADGFLAGQYTLDVAAGDIVTGMKITSATTSGTPISDITFKASNFKVVSGSETPVVLLDIKSGGVVFQPDVQSDNFVAGSSGWRIKNTGDAEFNTVIIRQEILHPLASPTFSPGGGDFDGSVNVTITQGAAYLIRYTTDGSYPAYDTGTATTITSGNSVELTNTTTLRAVAYNESRQSSAEASATYTKTFSLGDTKTLTITSNGPTSCYPIGTYLYPTDTIVTFEFVDECSGNNVDDIIITGGSGANVSYTLGFFTATVTLSSDATMEIDFL
jgi:hypothetical protein